jgi:group II intron reverse transcriptase/maturase
MMHDPRKSDSPIVPAKSPNNAGPTAAEATEGRGLAEGNADQLNAHRTQRRGRAHSALERVRQAAKRDRNAKFTALFHHLTIDRLRGAFSALRRRAAAGVDGVTWSQYGVDLEANLRDLHARLHRGAYRAKPSRRVFIPKADGRQRPLGIASLEDKIVQRAVVEILNAVYETDFLGFSYGFRPGRSQHQALDALATAIKRKRVNWWLDADLRDFFGTLDHGWLVKFIEHRIGDRRIIRLIQKWLRAGVLHDEEWTESNEGAPQGATISPLLSNLYLHYVLDLWVQQWRRRRTQGDVVIVRFADDFLIGFEHRKDAERFQGELRERLAKFALELHPEKTRLVEFGRFAAANRARRGLGAPDTFDFLGFTHICAKARNGGLFLRRKTMRKRMRAKLREVKTELQRRRHLPIPDQGRWLGAVVRGHAAYYGVPGNLDAVAAFRTQVARQWQRSLERRSQRGRMRWARMNRIANCWLPKARITHPWPNERFDVRTRGKSPVR